MRTSQSTLIGASGEHFVIHLLLRMGFIAAAAPQGAPNADIIVTNVGGTRTAVIQVKTTREIPRDGCWHMKEKHESLVADRLFYCFVNLGQTTDDTPTVFVVPSKVVAASIKESHSIWLKTPGRGGRPHQQTKMRRFGPDWLEQYRENWSILGLD